MWSSEDLFGALSCPRVEEQVNGFGLHWAGGVLADLIIGTIAAFCAILLVYALARPRLQFDTNMQVTRLAKGDRYGVRVRNSGRIPILTMRAEAFLILNVLNASRSTAVPIPLSRDTWSNVRRADSWRASPRLLIDEINWSRHLPHSQYPSTSRLEEVMSELGAKLYVRVTASSSIFSVAVVKFYAYAPADWELTPDSDPESAPERRSVLARLVAIAKRALLR